MREALELAKKAAEIGEVPVGAVMVHGGEIIARGSNYRENGKMATAHAELRCIEDACRVLGGWRLPSCQLYVTMEPCPMCAGAIINSRVERVVFGAYDKKAGSFGSVLNMNDFPLNHHPEIIGGVLEDECSAVISDFFRSRRDNKGIVFPWKSKTDK